MHLKSYEDDCPMSVRDWKKIYPLSETLAPLSRVGTKMRAPLKPPNTIECCVVGGVLGGPQLVSHDAERHQSHTYV